MLDDGTKAAGAPDYGEPGGVKVGDIAIHLLDAIEAGERRFDEQDTPLADAATRRRRVARRAGRSRTNARPAADRRESCENGGAPDDLSCSLAGVRRSWR